MSKAKELATLILNEVHDFKFTDTIILKALNLSHDILKEPDEPSELKGWIEVIRREDGSTKLLNMSKATVVGSELVDGVELGYITFGPEHYINTIEPYEEIKQKIKEAS